METIEKSRNFINGFQQILTSFRGKLAASVSKNDTSLVRALVRVIVI